MTTTRMENVWARRARNKNLRGIAKMREVRRNQWKHGHLTLDLLSSAIPGVLFTLAGGFWHNPHVLAHRNSAQNPREYFKATPNVDREELNLQVKDFVDRKGKFAYRKAPEVFSLYMSDEFIKTAIKYIKKIDAIDGYRPKTAQDKLVNITEDKDGNITVSVMKRDDKGRFVAGEVTRSYDDYTYEQLKAIDGLGFVRLHSYAKQVKINHNGVVVTLKK